MHYRFKSFSMSRSWKRLFLPILLVSLAAPITKAADGPEHTASASAATRVIHLASDARHTLSIPGAYQSRGNKVDVLVHFHGSPALVRQRCQAAGLNCVVINVTYSGLSSVYRNPFGSDRELFQKIIDEALAELRRQHGFSEQTEWGKLAVSSFSAGFGAIREILKTPSYFDRIDAIYLVDSLYCGYVGDGTGKIQEGVVHPGLMKDFLRYAQASADGEKVMIVTHCDGPTPGYASTRETADYLLEKLELQPQPVDLVVGEADRDKSELGVFRLYRTANRNGFSLYGSPGDNVADHVHHLRHMSYWLPMLPLDKQTDVDTSP